MHSDITLQVNGRNHAIGHFTTAERRNKLSLEAKRTHFIFGRGPQRLAPRLSRNEPMSQTIKVPPPASNSNNTQASSFQLGSQKINTKFWVSTYST